MNLSWLAVFMGLNFAWMYAVARGYSALTRREVTSQAQPLPESGVQRWMNQYEGRQWTSQSRFLGHPLIDVAFSSPGFTDPRPEQAGVARGWIAIGDFAVGRLIAFGNVAAAPIAIGTFSVGIVSVGVLTFGVFSLGIISVVMLTAGIIGVGLYALGIISIGYLAAVVVAIAWRGAQGVVAIAYHLALGEQAYATHANDEAAREYIGNSQFLQTAYDGLVRSADWMPGTSSIIVCFLIVLPIVAVSRLAYKRKVELVD